MDGDDDGSSSFQTPEKKRAQSENDNPESVLRGRIRDIFADTSMTPAQKFAAVNALRGVGATPTSTTPTATTKITKTTTVNTNAPPTTGDCFSSCPHYQRSCLMQCNVCGQMVLCRVCHEEMDRFKVAKLQCLRCQAVVDPASECSNCGGRFATYCCTVCHTYDSTPGKQIFHCDACGICRLGTRDSTFHCDRCHMCIVVNSEDGRTHKCFENSFRQDCAACLTRLFDSREPLSMLKCGHAMHQACFKRLLKNDFRCPTCKKAVVEIEEEWESFEEEMEQQLKELEGKIPAEVLNRVMKILCNECEKKFEAKFNPFSYYKCPHCKTFNTNPIDK